MAALANGSPEWFRPGHSKKKALATPVSLNTLSADIKAWRKVPLIPGQGYRSLSLWNGLDDEHSASLSISLYEPPLENDQLLISLNTSALRDRGIELAQLISQVREVLGIVGGYATIGSSNVAHAYPERKGALLLLWGEDRTGWELSHHAARHLQLDINSPIVPFNSWDDFENPDEDWLRELSEVMHRIEVTRTMLGRRVEPLDGAALDGGLVFDAQEYELRPLGNAPAEVGHVLVDELAIGVDLGGELLHAHGLCGSPEHWKRIGIRPPEAKPGRLRFVGNRILPGLRQPIMPRNDRVHFAEGEGWLCFGDPMATGQAVRWTAYGIAVLQDATLKAIWLRPKM
jgi:hypothetical protein